MSTRSNPSAAAPPSRREVTLVQRLMGFVMLLLAAAFMVWAVHSASRSTVIGTSVTVAVLMTLGLLSARYDRFERLMAHAFGAYFVFSIWLLVALAPVAAFRWLFGAVISVLPLWLQVPAFLALGALLGWALWAISTAARRERLFERLRAVGRFTPLLYVINVWMVAAMFFASATFILARRGVVAVGVTGADDFVFGRLLDFYVWHFFDLIPLVEVNKTLGWTEPLANTGGGLGFVLLLYKVAVIVPTIGAFAGYFEQRSRTGASVAPAAASPPTPQEEP